MPPRPRSVRFSCTLVVCCALLSLTDAVAGLLVLRHFDAVSAELIPTLGGLDSSAGASIAEGRTALVSNIIIAFGMAAALGALASAVPRPAPHARPVAAAVMAIVALFMLCGIATGPEVQVSPTGLETPEVRRGLEQLMPLWFSTMHGVVVTAVLAAMGTAAALLSRESATEYYRRRDGRVRWYGFTSWLDVFPGRGAAGDR